MNREMRSLTGIRAFAALLVLMLHFNQSTPGYNFGDYLKIINMGHIGVDIFFILSGFIITHVYGGGYQKHRQKLAITFIRNRIARLFPAHLFALSVTVILWIIAKLSGYNFNHGENWILSDLLLNALLLQAWFMGNVGLWNAPSWSVSAELFAYLSFIIFFPLIHKAIRSWAFILILSCSIALVYGFKDVDLATSFKAWSAIFRVTSEFWLGVALYHHRLRFVGVSPYLFYICIIILVMAPELGAPDWTMIYVASLLILSAERSQTRLLESKLIVYLGKISYSVYIIHFPVQLIIYKLYGLMGIENRSMAINLLWYVGSIATAFFVGAILFHYLEEPARKFIRSKWGLYSI